MKETSYNKKDTFDFADQMLPLLRGIAPEINKKLKSDAFFLN